MSPKKYFAKNLELCVPINFLFSTAASATKLADFKVVSLHLT